MTAKTFNQILKYNDLELLPLMFDHCRLNCYPHYCSDLRNHHPGKAVEIPANQVNWNPDHHTLNLTCPGSDLNPMMVWIKAPT